MDIDPFARLAPLAVAFGAAILAVGVFRLTAINTFIDHRKTALRNQLRDDIRRSPFLLVAIQRLGKTRELAQQEETLFASLHPAYGVLAREIQTRREWAFSWTLWLGVAFVAWLLTCIALVVAQFPSEQSWTVALKVMVVVAIAIVLVFFMVRTLQPGISRATDPDKLGGYLTKAFEELNGIDGQSPLAPSSTTAMPSAIGLSDLWGLQETMLQSYRLLFATVESILLVGAMILVRVPGDVQALVLAGLGLMLALVWITVCRARARAVVFMHWLIRRVETGNVVAQPYASLREFQESRTHGAIRVLDDPDFRRLRSTLTGRRMDLHVPTLFVLAWLTIAALSLR